MQHCIRFNGHISWEGQSNGLPATIHAFLVVDGNNSAAINELIESQLRASIGSQSFCCQKDQGQIIDLRTVPSDRMLVPFHWITRIDVDLFPLPVELSEADEVGVQRLKDGTEPLKN